MKKQQLVWIVVLVIVAAVLVLVFTQRPMTDEEIVRGAVLGSGSATCTFVDSDTDEEFDIMFKNGKVRMNGVFDGYEFFLVTGEENVHVWDTMTNEGIFFPISESMEMGVHRFDDREMLFDDIKDKVVHCSAETIPDELFEIPEDIAFYTEEDFFMRQFDFDLDDLDFEIEDLEIDDLDIEEMEDIE